MSAHNTLGDASRISHPGQVTASSMSPKTPPSSRNTRLAADELERVDLGKMNLQLIANEKNEDCAHAEKMRPAG